MAELSLHGKHQAKRLEPSPLRNEVRAESVVEERRLERSPIRAPDSQYVIRETQLEHHQDNESDYGDPLSPSSAALLDRTAVKKSIEMTEPSSLLFTPLLKESILTLSSSAPATSVGFTFGQPKKANSKIPPRPEAPVTQPETKASAAVHSGDGDHIIHVSPPSFLPAVGAEVFPKHFHSIEDRFLDNAIGPSSDVPVVVDNAQDGTSERESSCDTLTNLPPSAQCTVGSVAPTKITQKVRKGKKGKKATGRKLHGVPWPPRPSVPVLKTVNSSPADNSLRPERPVVHMESPPTGQEASQTILSVKGNVSTAEEPHEEQDQTLERLKCSMEDAKAQGHQLGTNEIDMVLPPHERPLAKVPDALPEAAFDEVTNADHVQHDPSSLPRKSGSAVGPILLGPEILFDVPMQHGQQRLAPAPRMKVRNTTSQSSTRSDISEHHIGGLESVGRHEHPVTRPKYRHSQATKTGVAKERLDQTVESGSHTAVGHHSPYRVEKVQRKRRVSSVPQHVASSVLLRNRSLAVQDDFDKTLEDLREAYHADKYQKQCDMATQSKHFNEVKALLQDQIHQYTITVTEWKNKYDALNTSTLYLREKAKTNQKYVTGLQKDHEKLQKSVLVFQDDCKKALQQKIIEVEYEKQSLQRELETTLESLAKGQRTLKGTVDELYVRLIISESKRKDLAESLAKQVSIYDEERTRRKDLETKLLPLFQTVQRQLGDRSTQIVLKLESLQASVDGVTSGLSRDSGVQECLDVLRKLQDTPFLTIKDVQKTERMLRYVHGSLCSKFDALVQSVDNKTYPTEDVQTFISNQLHDLRSEMLRFHDVVAESRRARESNDGVSRELEAERHRAQNPNDELKMRKAQLECQIADVGDDTRSHGSSIPDSRQEAEGLREKIKEVEDECCVAKSEVERLQRNIQKRDRKLVDYGASIVTLKEECERLSEQLNQKVQPPDVTQLRNEIEKDLQQGFIDRESGYRNNIHRLTVERDGLQALVGEHDKKLDAAEARCEEVMKDVSNFKSELEIARTEKLEMESRYKLLQRKTQDHPLGTPEITTLKEQLRQKSDELRSLTEELTELKSAFAQSESRRTSLLEAWEQQRTEISHHPVALESLRQEADSEKQEERKKSEAAIQLAQNKTLASTKKKEDMQAKLEQTQLNEVKLSNAHAALLLERDGLRHRNAELESAQENGDTHLLRLQEEHRSKMRRYEENIDTLRRHQERSTSALKELEAMIQLQKTEHLKKIKFDGEKYEAIIRTLEEELKRAKAATVTGHASRPQSLQSSVSKNTFAREVQDINSGKGRKKVNRGNNSVLNVSGTPGTLTGTSARYANIIRHAPERSHSETLFDEETQDDQTVSDQRNSIIDPAAELIEETQDIFQDLLPFEGSNHKATSGSLGGSQRTNSVPTDVSSLSASLRSDELFQLQEESRYPDRLSTPVLHDRHRTSDTQHSSQERVLETPTRSSDLSGSSLHSSQSKDRPRSQANTASRLMPPPGSKSDHFDQRKLSSARQGKATASHHETSNSRFVSRVGHGSQSAIVQELYPPSRQRQHGARQTRIGRPDKTSSASKHSHGQKRQITFEQGATVKRQRTSSQSLPTNPPSSSHSYSPHPSRKNPSRSLAPATGAEHSRIGNSPSRPSVSSSMGSHSRAQPSSSVVDRPSASRISSSNNKTKAHSQPSSASQSTVGAASYNYHGRRQTRSKTREIERFAQEMRAG